MITKTSKEKNLANPDSRINAGSVLSRRLADLAADGRIQITDAGLDSLSSLQNSFRQRRRNDPQRDAKINTSWSGKVLNDLAEAACEHLIKHSEIGSGLSVRAIWRELLRLGHNLTIGQVRYGVGLIDSATTPEEIWKVAKEHHSYGDWWRNLSTEERCTVINNRRLSQFHYLKSLSSEQHRERREKLTDQYCDIIAQAASPEDAEKARKQFARAMTLDLAMKSVEEGEALASGRQYSGVVELMRSSWEALYARAVHKSPNRFYIYEPIGFPLINPANGRFEAYHPDFVEYTNVRSGGVRNRIIEIKGYLTETGQRKIELFQRYYIDGDFSAIPAHRQEIFQKLVAKVKQDCADQFGITLGPTAEFRVYGWLPWNKAINNFDATQQFGRGFVQRLAQRCPKLVPGPTPELSNTQRRDLTKSLTDGRELWKPVTPNKTLAKPSKLAVPAREHLKIQRSKEFVCDSHVGATVFINIFALFRETEALLGQSLNAEFDLQRLLFLPACFVHQSISWDCASHSEKQLTLLSLNEAIKSYDLMLRSGNEDAAAGYGLVTGLLQSSLTLMSQIASSNRVLPSDAGFQRSMNKLHSIQDSAREQLSYVVQTLMDYEHGLPQRINQCIFKARTVAFLAVSRYHAVTKSTNNLDEFNAHYGIDQSYILDQVVAGFTNIAGLAPRRGSNPIFRLPGPAEIMKLKSGDSHHFPTFE